MIFHAGAVKLPGVCVRTVHHSVDQIDVTAFGEGAPHYVAGPVHITMELEMTEEGYVTLCHLLMQEPTTLPLPSRAQVAVLVQALRHIELED